MEEDSTNTLRDHKNKLDNICADVMPDSWEGHARITIRESEDVPESIEDKAIAKAVKLADKKGVKPERAANKLVSKLVKKQE